MALRARGDNLLADELIVPRSQLESAIARATDFVGEVVRGIPDTAWAGREGVESSTRERNIEDSH